MHSCDTPSMQSCWARIWHEIRNVLILAVLLKLSAAPDLRADTVTFGSGANMFDMEFVAIGNPGNPADPNGSSSGPVGEVDYEYNMGKYEVSVGMIRKANALGALGIAIDGGSNTKPSNAATWNGAARFVNWLNTSQGFPPAYKFATQPGDDGYSVLADIELWDPADAGFDADNLFRNTMAHYFLPSIDEWHKAAYYDPISSGYVNYATGSNTAPTPVAHGTTANTAVWGQPFSAGPADILQAGGLSLYGTMAQDGNVGEWSETEYDLMNDSGSSPRATHSGAWFEPIYTFGRGLWFSYEPDGLFIAGFRVASILEVVPPANDADFDGDGDVDGEDLAAWNGGFGEFDGLENPAAPADGDANGDLIVDGNDFLVWQQQFDQFIPTTASGAATPEPTAFALAALCAVSCCCRARPSMRLG